MSSPLEESEKYLCCLLGVLFLSLMAQSFCRSQVDGNLHPFVLLQITKLLGPGCLSCMAASSFSFPHAEQASDPLPQDLLPQIAGNGCLLFMGMEWMAVSASLHPCCRWNLKGWSTFLPPITSWTVSAAAMATLVMASLRARRLCCMCASSRGSSGRGAGREAATEGNRLSKVLAAMGVASRRASEALIFDGMVTVNGEVVTTPQMRVDPRKDKIRVRGKTLAATPPRSVYYALNKPKGYLCSNKSDTSSGKLVLDLFEERFQKEEERRKKKGESAGARPRLFTVGRLDVATTGLLLVTNDGQWAQKISHPSNGLTKEYIVTAAHKITRAQFTKVAEGAEFDGTHIAPVAVAPVSDSAEKIRIVVNEGKYHEVRILVESAGINLKNLKRVRVGGFRMPRTLKVGQVMNLNSKERAMVLDKRLQSLPE